MGTSPTEDAWHPTRRFAFATRIWSPAQFAATCPVGDDSGAPSVPTKTTYERSKLGWKSQVHKNAKSEMAVRGWVSDGLQACLVSRDVHSRAVVFRYRK
eukprot:6179548-Pleurochrysis_carterae.AAC.2